MGVTGGDAVAEKRIDFTYDDAGQYATIVYYDDTDGGAGNLVMTATYTYDDVGQLTGLVYTDASSATLRSFAWAYDDAGQVISHDSDISSEDITAYTYDATGQLLSVDYADQQASDDAYAYDDNGNRVTANGDTYSTGDDNRLHSDGTYTYTYDAEGNRVAKFVDANSNGELDSGDTDVTTYTWDYRDRLTEVDHYANYTAYNAGDSDQIVAYTYDYANRLIARTLDADGSQGTGDVENSVYVYDGAQAVLQFDATSPLPPGQGEGNLLTASDLSHRYVWNPQAVDQLLADEQLSPLPPGEGFDLSAPGEVLWALTDRLNSIRDLATYDSGSDTTTIANHRVYDAYGNLTSQTNAAVDCLFGYTGRQFDEATGLQNNLNRWYDPAVGRWLSADPLTFGAGDANLYRYCNDSPLVHTDPAGQRSEPKPPIIVPPPLPPEPEGPPIILPPVPWNPNHPEKPPEGVPPLPPGPPPPTPQPPPFWPKPPSKPPSEPLPPDLPPCPPTSPWGPIEGIC